MTDYEDVQELTRELTTTAQAIETVTTQLTEAERKALTRGHALRTAYTRAFLASTRKTLEERKAEASLATEQEELDSLKCEQVVKELHRRHLNLKKHLDTLTVLSNNARAMVKL